MAVESTQPSLELSHMLRHQVKKPEKIFQGLTQPLSLTVKKIISYDALTKADYLVHHDLLRVTINDRPSFEGLFIKHVNKLDRAYLRILKPSAKLEDVLINQDVFLERRTKLYTAYRLDLASSLEALTRLGCQVSKFPTSLEAFKADFDLFNLYSELVLELFKVGVIVYPGNFTVSCTNKTVRYTLQVGDRICLLRECHLASRTIKHDEFSLAKDLQNQGLSKRIFKLSYDEYVRAKILKVTLCAGGRVGSWAWMTYGFSTLISKAIEIVSRFTKDVLVLLGPSQLQITTKACQALSTVILNYQVKYPTQTRIPLNLLAEASKDELGNSSFKAWLIETRTPWQGLLELTNESQVNYLKTFLI